jgi:hypothetical protein
LTLSIGHFEEYGKDGLNVNRFGGQHHGYFFAV